MKLDPFIVKPGSRVSLKDYDPRFISSFEDKDVKYQKDGLKAHSDELLKRGVQLLAEFQDKLYAQNTYALLCIFQAMDAAGKDGTIKHVMSGVNPQGCQVFSFKQPSVEELDHDYLWRYSKALPERGRIGIFNRSYYEEVLIVRVHEELLERQQLPKEFKQSKNVWKQRFEEINNFEKYLENNGIIILKFFLNLSKEEQKERFMERLDKLEKNWKFSTADVKERQLWDKYMEAYEDVFSNTSTEWAPWYIIPADRKWYTRLVVAGIIHETLGNLGLAYPEVTEAQKAALAEARKLLEQEKQSH